MTIKPPINTEIFIRENATDIIKQYEPDKCMLTDNPFFHALNWNKGIYSCDCQRGLFFSKTESKAGIKDACGRNKYNVELRDKDTGQIYYTEFI